jgi:hypothetical protein
MLVHPSRLGFGLEASLFATQCINPITVIQSLQSKIYFAFTAYQGFKVSTLEQLPVGFVNLELFCASSAQWTMKRYCELD